MSDVDYIDGFTPEERAAVQTADVVLLRVKKGVVSQREATRAELLQVLRGYELFRDTTLHLLRQQQEAARNSMGVFDRAGRETS